MTRLLIMGPPGSGKGTQAVHIAEKMAVPAISTGDIFRYNVKELTDLGKEAKSYMDAGNFVPDDVTNRMVADRLQNKDVANGFLLDGYPRTAGQVQALESMLQDKGETLTAVLVLEVPDEEIVERLLARAATEGRSDDTEDVIKHRLELYHKETADLIETYVQRGIVGRVDGTGAIDDITERLLQTIYNIRARTGTLPVIKPKRG